MSTLKEKKQVFQIKDISNDGVINKVNDSSENVNIKTDIEKYRQNKKFIKTNEIKENTYKEQIVEARQTLIRNIFNAKYENTDNKKKTTKNLPSKVLRGSEYTLDQLLSEDEEDLGIDTIIRTKAGIKGSVRLTRKNYEVGKRVGKKVYKIATSEQAKSIYAGTINTTKKVYEKGMDYSTKIYAEQKAKAYVKANSLKERQKREIKRKMKEKAKEKIEQTAYMIASKVKDVLVSLFTKKVVLVGLLIITLIITLISAVAGITSIFAYSVNLALDDNVTMITEYISELDYGINSQIDNAPEDYPYVDKFVYNVPERAETNEEQVYAYLKAKYGDEKISETVIKGEIDQIHNNLYDLDFSEKTKTWTETKEDGTEVKHSRTTMTITLTSKTFLEFYEENRDNLLEEHQQKDYENILKLMKENVGKMLNNPFPKVDWRNYVTSEYGYRADPMTGEMSKHTGIDIALSSGTEIHSCMSGTVHTFNARDDGFGLYVTVTNGMYKTLYAHCSEILVEDGERVNAGDVIAKVGNTGKSTGSHLHLEYFVNESRKNPRAYLKIYEE